MAIANDTFVESSDTDLYSHTPTGANAGAGWERNDPPAGASILVSGTEDKAVDNNGSHGNRSVCTTDLGFDEMDVEGDFETSATSGFVFIGVIGRAGGGQQAGWIEFYWDCDTQTFRIGDTITEISVADTQPSNPFNLRLEIRQGSFKGYCNGVLKLTMNSNIHAGHQKAGILLGNFTGSAGLSKVDNYKSQGVKLMRRGGGFFAF